MLSSTRSVSIFISLFFITGMVLADNQANQARMDLYYAPENIIRVTISMNSDAWNSLRNQTPQGGQCNNEYTGSRYTWFEANSLKVQVTNPEVATYSYPGIGVKKKSYCGSISSVKPSLNINIAKYIDANESLAEESIGSKYLTLNNSAQDSSMLKQCLGYELFRVVGLATSRCNFSSVSIYFPDTDRSVYLGIYVNVEPIKKKYLKNKDNDFSATDTGNLYEFSTHDFNLTGILYDDYKGYSDKFIWQDFALVAEEVESSGVNGVKSTVDVSQFNKYWAMEGIIQHRDGYSRNLNNAYAYNDNNLEDAGALSTENTNIEFLPWGIDGIFESQSCWQIYRCAIVARTLFDSTDDRDRLMTAVNEIVNTFSSEIDSINIYIDSLAASANATWTGLDKLYGKNDGTINESAIYLKSWMVSAINNAVSSIDHGRNNSCKGDCPMNSKQ